MKRVTATDARRDWFRLLDEVAAGGVVAIERSGTTILLKRAPERAARRATVDYSELIRVPEAEQSDRWSWVWPGPESELEPTELE